MSYVITTGRLTVRMPGSSRPTVTVVEPGRELQWVGTLVTRRLFHGSRSLVPEPDGVTHLVDREEFSGALVALTQRFVKRNDAR